jgi:hypothetical protein
MQLLQDSYTFRPIGKAIIVESASGAKVYRRTGVFQNYKKKNCNGRIYPESIWKKTFEEGSKFRTRLGQRSVLGLLEHPKDGQTRLDYKPAILVTDAHIATPEDIRESVKRGDANPVEEGDIVGTFEILGTEGGKELQALDEAGVTYGVSSRGTGTVKESDGAAIVQEDFDLETWDAVYNPSVERALPVRTEDAPKKDQQRDCIRCESTFTYTPGGKNDDDVCPKCKGNPNRTDMGKTSQEGVENANANKPGSSAEPVPQRVQESKPTMSTKLTEMRTLESQIVQLTATNTKGLNVPAKASLLHTVTEQRVAVDRLVVEDPALKTYAARLHKRLTEFEREVSAGPAPEASPKPAPALAPKPEAGAPAPEAAPEDAEMSEEDLLRQAAEMLAAKLADDPEAQQLADQLNAKADELAPPAEDPNAAPAPAPDAAPAPAPEADPSTAESKFKALEARHKRLLATTATILERYKALKESSSTEGLSEDGKAPRAVAVQLMSEKQEAEKKATEWEKTARDLAEKYNTDMIAVGIKHWEMKRPDLFEKVKDRLIAAKTFEEFTSISEAILKENGVEATKADTDPKPEGDPAAAEAAPKADEPAKPETDAAPAPAKEDAAPAQESKPTAAEPSIVEAAQPKVHPAVAMAARGRKHRR